MWVRAKHQGETPLVQHRLALLLRLREAVQFHEDSKNSLIRHHHRGFFPESIFGNDTVFRGIPLHVLQVLVE